MRSFAESGEAAEERFDRLFRAYYGRVLAYALRRTHAEVAQDVAAETFVVAWRRLDRLPKEPLPWLLGIARKTLANERRSARRRDALMRELAHQEPTSRFAEAAETKLALGEISAALGRLPEADREVLELVAWDGLEIGEAAQVLGVSSATVRVRLHRARRRLGLKLQSRAGDQAAPDPFPSLTEEVR